ncbi:MAG: tRNA epoxyqueuosine(34) reductase QueG [Cohaesibacteraceae bacterium]|nr:tRNA epoxyqueuosine(34) reductase QueG [Cohaesibacteraceae bacterium]
MQKLKHNRETSTERLVRLFREDAKEQGFDQIGFTTPNAIPQARSRLQEFLDAGYHASMKWMEETRERRADPSVLWPGVKSIIMLAMNYGPSDDPLELLQKMDKGNISVYARHRDYHDVIKGRLKGLSNRLLARAKQEFDADIKVFVDTAPVMEKPLAEAAGLGWQGKHTNLVSRELGSWFFLGAIFTTLDLPTDTKDIDHCGSCTACLDICPTGAFPAPYQLDARKCISYLTIEHHGPVPIEFRSQMGNRIYGCDDCLAICPWNKFASAASEIKLKARDDLLEPELVGLSQLTDATFRKLFSGSPVKRIGRDRFIRNVLIALGNAGVAGEKNEIEILAIERLLADIEPQVRGAAVWALAKRVGLERFMEMKQRFGSEKNIEVLAEWIEGELICT